MGACSLFLAAAVGATSLASPETAHFPGGFFESHAKASLQRRAMESWPGPSQLVARWKAGALERQEKVALLLGAAAFHDPVLLPLYREALASDDERLRMAAAYGYRNLIADSIPWVAGGVDDAAARALAAEVDAVASTLRERPLVELWLQAALANEDASMPGWRGVVLQRPVGVCTRALEAVVVVDDLELLATAFRTAETRELQLVLLQLLEAVTLQRFFVKPMDPGRGWGIKHVNEAVGAAEDYLEYWIDRRCSVDPKTVLASSMTAMQAPRVDPRSPDSYYVWQRILLEGRPPWRMTAARVLYEFGGRWQPLPASRAASAKGETAREALLEWYLMRPRRQSSAQPAVPAGGGAPP
jgi:hypothetical protein